MVRKTNPVSKAYESTAHEREVARSFQNRKSKRGSIPRIKVHAGSEPFHVGPDHPDPAVASLLLMHGMGTISFDFMEGLLAQLANAGSQGKKADERGINFMLSVVHAVQPKDELEAMLAAQMAAVHMATMTFARRLAHVENILKQDSAERAFNKLARTFAAQMETLKRYRNGGEQKVTVQHVTVNEGGQAVVGHVSNGGGGGQLKNPESTS